MKKIFNYAIVAVLMICATSCYVTAPQQTAPSKSVLMNTATYRSVSVDTPITPPIIADLVVSSEKISYPLIPSAALLKTDFENLVNTAVKEALRIHGNADVLIGLEYQVKTDDYGVIESVVVSGYPATYTNFRHPNETIWLKEDTFVKE